MGIFDWLFPKKLARTVPSALRYEEDPVGRFAEDRHMPPGDWVKATVVVEVTGVQYRRDDAMAFAKAARRAEKSGKHYGVRLNPEPHNPHDRKAIAVYGVADSNEWLIGYIPAAISGEISDELVSENVPISAQLYSIYVSQGGYIDFKILILAPPGNSVSSRKRRKKAAP